MSASRFSVAEGSIDPLGVSLIDGGVNVAVFSRHASSVFISFFDGETETVRFRLPGRYGDVHYGLIKGVSVGQRYGLRADGPWDPKAGHLFDQNKLLVDPYATSLDRAFSYHPDLGVRGAETSHLVPKCIVGKTTPKVLPLPPERPGFIYEIAVKAFTKLHPDIPEHMRGKVSALGHPVIIEHLTTLGVDTVELMPLMAWIDERHLQPLGLSNAWGYNSVTFMAPDPRLAPGGFEEIRAAVNVLHEAGIRVVLDVVFNHSGESDLQGPTVCLRGLDDATYYQQIDGVLANDTGCGNTLALDRGPGVRLVMDAMRHWVSATGIDGFRYDLATVLGRTPRGFEPDAPLLSAIQQDPLLGPLIHIAEPWDIGPGGYRLGEFPAPWHEWNDRYRDDVRRFWRGDPGAQGAMATRLAGSSDVFGGSLRRPSCSINFVAAHDGFTLRDAVNRVKKDNFANGEGNRDGNASEVSWVATDAYADAKALLSTLFVSRGTPMLTAGDEFGRSQAGNNNAYAQDNQTTWLNWSEAKNDLIADVAMLAAFRKKYEAFFPNAFFNGEKDALLEFPDVQWLGATGEELRDKGWSDPALQVFVAAIFNRLDHSRLLVCFNRAHVTSNFGLPPSQAGKIWTALADFPVKLTIKGDKVQLPARSVCALIESIGKSKSDGVADSTIDLLAREAGIQGEWWEVDGSHHAVSVETKRLLLSAMAIPLGSNREAREALQLLRHRGIVPAVHLAKANTPSEIAVDENPQSGSRTLSFLLKGDDGDCRTLSKPAGRSALTLPPLSTGYYTLTCEDDVSRSCQVLVSPGRCYLPEQVVNGDRLFGFNAHLYSLRHSADMGIGDFETLARFCEFSARSGGSVSGINPLHSMFTDDRSRVSPYQPSDRRFIDPIYIDVVGMAVWLDLSSVTVELEARHREIEAMHLEPYVDYKKVWELKDRLLRKGFAQFEKRGGAPPFERFIEAGGNNLVQHASFESRIRPQDSRYVMWLQWIADVQITQAAQRGQNAGLTLGIYRDLALGCAYEGGEVWSQAECFASNVSLGAPPDPFARKGQIWNLPPFNPIALHAKGFMPYADVMRANMRHAGVLRIDHILGYERQFWVPRGAEGADGAYVKVNTEALVAMTAIESHRANCMVIGEDLGTVPEGFRERMADAAILSYRMLWFEQDAQGFHPASSYPRLSAACLSSHDLVPFKGWTKSADASDIAKLERATNAAGFCSNDLMVDAHAFIASAPSALVLVQADDLTNEIEPLNVPGTDTEKPNWRRKLSVEVEKIPDLPSAQQVIQSVRNSRPQH